MKLRSLALFLFFLSAGAPCNAEPLKAGFITPLTGSRAGIGEDARRAALLALNDLPPGKLEILFEDSQGDPLKGVTAYNNLRQRAVKLIITQNSNVSVPISQLATRDGVVQLAISTTSDRYATPDDLSFRVNGSTREEAQFIIDYLAGQLAVRPGVVAVVTMEDEYPLNLSRNIELAAKQKGLAIGAKENFLPEAGDFRSQIARLKARGVTHLILLMYQAQAGQFIKQQHAAGFRTTMTIGCSAVNNREFFEIAGALAEGVLSSHIAVDRTHPAAQAFIKKHGYEPNVYAANAYDAVVLAYRALTDCGPDADPLCLKQALFAIKGYRGMSGYKSFDDVFGDMMDSYHMLVVTRGKFVEQ